MDFCAAKPRVQKQLRQQIHIFTNTLCYNSNSNNDKKQTTLERRLSFIGGIARGMLHLHKERVIHRDLAARNILLTKHLVSGVISQS